MTTINPRKSAANELQELVEVLDQFLSSKPMQSVGDLLVSTTDKQQLMAIRGRLDAKARKLLKVAQE